MNPYPVALVTWIDIEDCTSPSWVSPKDAKRDSRSSFKILHSVGFVVFQDDERICLASTWGPDTSGILKIPKGVCKSVQILTE